MGSLSAFGGGVDSLLAGPDSAAILARRYVNDTKRASVLGLFGTAAYVVLLVHSDNFRNDIDAVSGTAAVASVGFALATIPFTLRSLRNLSRAVWHYNAALAAR